MWPRRYHLLSPLIEVYSDPKGIKMIWNYELDSAFKKIEHMVYAETLLHYIYCTIIFVLNTYAFDKPLRAVIC